jgi:hypothetical protein
MSKNGFWEILPRFFLICDDKEKLASRHKNNNLRVVTIIFYYFKKKVFKNIVYCQYMTTLDNEKLLKSCELFFCKKCDYNTERRSSYVKHLSTRKHQKTTQNNAKVVKSCDKPYECAFCEKLFSDRAGLWRHKKKCYDYNDEELATKHDLNNTPELVTLITELVKSNNELQHSILEICKNGTMNNSNNTTNINSNNKSFNLQFFLNETCKDAMNIMDFVDSIQLQLSDLEKVGEIGYVEGISNIIVKNLNALDVTKRPIHCTDKKREVLYVKDEDKWEKENTEKEKITKAIQKVVHKNIQQIPDWVKQNPHCKDSDSKKNDQYLHLLINSMSGSDEDEVETNMNKIIHNISKEVVIDK